MIADHSSGLPDIKLLLPAIGPDLRWLVGLFVVNFATKRLTFLSAEVKAVLGDVYFVLALVFAFHAIWKLNELASEWLRERAAEENRLEQLDPIFVLLNRLARIVLVLVFLIVLLSNFGVNVSAFAVGEFRIDKPDKGFRYICVVRIGRVKILADDECITKRRIEKIPIVS